MNNEDPQEVDLDAIDLDEEELPESSERERASLLASVMKDQAQRDEAKAKTFTQGPKPLGPQLIALALSTVVAVYVWFGSPGWLDPTPPPPPSMAEESSAVQVAVWLGIQQVEAFRLGSGRVPGAQELGPLPPSVEYQRLDAQSYLVAGMGNRVGVTFSSGEPMDQFHAAIQEVFAEAGDR